MKHKGYPWVSNFKELWENIDINVILHNWIVHIFLHGKLTYNWHGTKGKYDEQDMRLQYNNLLKAAITIEALMTCSFVLVLRQTFLQRFYCISRFSVWNASLANYYSFIELSLQASYIWTFDLLHNLQTGKLLWILKTIFTICFKCHLRLNIFWY